MEDYRLSLTSDDADMNAAIARARDTLPTFWASYDAPPSETGHGLKVRFAVGPTALAHLD